MKHGMLPLILSSPPEIDRARSTPPPPSPDLVYKLHVLTWGQVYKAAVIFIVALLTLD